MPRKRRVNTCGHPERKHMGHGRCPSCYTRHLRATNPKYSKEARKAEEIQRRYGISIEDRDRIIECQAGRCGLCRKPFCDDRQPHIDHCHDTGRVRGVLCFSCNKALGMFGDNEIGLVRAIQYLRQPTQQYISGEVMWW